MRDLVQTQIIEALKTECDEAAKSDDAQRLRKLHAFMLSIATSYVQLRLGAIDSRVAGKFEANGVTIDGPADAQDLECVAAETIEDTSARASKNIHGWHVIDSDGGIWWPGEDADREIEESDEPEQTALAIFKESPMRGIWHL